MRTEPAELENQREGDVPLGRRVLDTVVLSMVKAKLALRRVNSQHQVFVLQMHWKVCSAGRNKSQAGEPHSLGTSLIITNGYQFPLE